MGALRFQDLIDAGFALGRRKLDQLGEVGSDGVSDDAQAAVLRLEGQDDG
jgi:hypothetical protein